MSLSLQRLLEPFQVPTHDPEILVRQYGIVSRQTPVLYAILISNSAALCWYCYGHGPVLLTLWFPLALGMACAIRTIWWLAQSGKPVDDAVAIRRVRQVHHLAFAVAVVYIVWSGLLMLFCDVDMRLDIGFYAGVTLIGCIGCLSHVQAAANTCAALTIVSFTLLSFLLGGHEQQGMSLNIALVTAAMASNLSIVKRDFWQLVASQRSLAAEQAATKALSDENFRIANLDALTALPNRRRFFKDLETAIATADATGSTLAVGVIDLDGFKPINDTFGHSTGDRLLTEVAGRLERAVVATERPDVPVFRLGGDEFGFIVGRDTDAEALMRIGTALTDSLRSPFALTSGQAVIGCSIGVAVRQPGASTADVLFDRADYALYHAKRSSRGQVVLFSDEHEAQIRSDALVEQALLAADLARELSVRYQPIVDLATGRIRSAEALARWDSPTLGSVAPARFIVTAERIGIIGRLTAVLLEKALQDAREWPPEVGLSFNLSAHDVSSCDGALRIIAAVRASGLDPRRVCFEITETAVTADMEKACRTMAALRTIGCRIALDDFGTGYSSLSAMHQFPLDQVKIDRSFVVDIAHDPASRKLVRSVIHLCEELNLACVVEGIETVDQLAILREFGCGYAQGYLFAHPEPAEVIRGGSPEPSDGRTAVAI